MSGIQNKLERATKHYHEKGYHVSPGSDKDVDLLVCDVTGTPTLGWNESGDKFTFNKNLGVTGNIIVSGTVDGRNVAADGAVLDGIEAGATRDRPGDGKIHFGGSVQSGWLLCNGAAVSKTTYADLFAAIGFNFGGGDPGGGNFYLPDSRQRFLLGKAASGTGSTLGSTGGAIDHTHVAPNHVHGMGSHSHSLSNAGAAKILVGTARIVAAFITKSFTGTKKATPAVTSGSYPESWATPLMGNTDSESLGNTDGAGASNTTTGNPPFLVINYIIKT